MEFLSKSFYDTGIIFDKDFNMPLPIITTQYMYMGKAGADPKFSGVDSMEGLV